MRICRFSKAGSVGYGVVDKDQVTLLKSDPFEDFALTDTAFSVFDIHLLAPVGPSKIVAVGLNYADHAEESNLPVPANPLLFLKPPTSVIGPGDDIVYPAEAKRVDYEGELAVVVGKRCRRVAIDEAPNVIVGYTCLNDVSERVMQAKDGQWTRAKSYDTFCPIGPYIVTDVDPARLKIETYLNGERKQFSNTKNLIFSVPQLVSFISQVMTLLPGDLIATGTPGGIGPMSPGDTVEVRIEGIGSLTNNVVAEARIGLH